MAEVQPFRAWRYDVGQVGDLSDVTAPPYDVISPDEQKELYERHPCNVVRLILNREEPGDDDSGRRYERAADFLRHWQREGMLRQEHEEALYAYHQEYDWEGRHYVRKGFLARLRLQEFGTGTVFPHEETLSGPKADRLALTKACRMNLSPIFGLYPDEGRVQDSLDEAIRRVTGFEATDRLNVRHRVWPVTDPAAINRVREQVREKPVFIADGHHRYETALNYRHWLREQGQLAGDAAAANFVLMHFVGMSDPGLAILPTHRLVSGLPDLTADDVRSVLGSQFETEPMGTGPDGARRTWEMMQADGGQDVFGLGTTADGQWLLARLTYPRAMSMLASDHCEEWQRLGVSILHRLVLEHLLHNTYPNHTQALKYVHRLDEVVEAQQSRSCQLACLVAPAEIEHVRAIASKFEKMPPKSTYFYPKLLSGLVFNPLE